LLSFAVEDSIISGFQRLARLIFCGVFAHSLIACHVGYYTRFLPEHITPQKIGYKKLLDTGQNYVV
jgi:hypothetical protein